MNKKIDSSTYSAFADIYDQVMRDVDYDSWAQHVISLCKRYKIRIHKILELACGTGSLALKLVKDGYQVVGIDLSEQMLEQANGKFAAEGLAISLYRGKMESFSSLRLDHDFDLITCLYDSLNYLLEEEDVKNCFVEAFTHLRPGGAFIFDVTTEYNLLHNFAGYTFAENFDNASYIWENEYQIETKICFSKVSVFLNTHSHYRKYVEVHSQRIYTNARLMEMLREAGFDLLGTFHNITEEPVMSKCERIHFVCRKPDTNDDY
ncbi:MAG: class I SAM-dependent methyltransferase [Candidatus Omnitrophota bacterium]|jgi:ubiquinone/menaquinone biosynthesis C-methylase UbiE|nr:MAG: class I SAM-dependent methyltransferase [Candidatus Omnitrophota bacterium]